MNKLSKAFGIALVSTICLHQTTQAQISVGLRTGVNLANIRIDSDEPDYFGTKYKAKTGVNVALLLNYNFGESPLSIQLEPGISQRGGKVKYDETINIDVSVDRLIGERTISSNYIELPVMIKFSPKIGIIEGIASIGPQFGYLTSPMKFKSVVKGYKDGDLIGKETDSGNLVWGYDQTPDKLNIGIVGGLGAAVPFGNLKVFAEGRYTYGLPFINESYPDLYSNKTMSEKVSNKGVSISIGALYRLGN